MLPTPQPQRRPTGNQQRDPRRHRHNVGEHWPGGQHLLEVIQDEQHASVPQEPLHGFGERLAADVQQAERCGQGRNDQCRIANGCEVDEDGAVREGPAEPRRELDGQTGLAGASRTGQREQANVRRQQLLAKFDKLPLAPDQRRRLRRKCCRVGRGGHVRCAA